MVTVKLASRPYCIKRKVVENLLGNEAIGVDMRAWMTFGLLIVAGLFVQGLSAQSTPAVALPSGGSDFAASASGGIDFEVTLAPGGSFTTGDLEITDADNPGGGQVISVTGTVVTAVPTGATAATDPTGITGPGTPTGAAGAAVTISWTGTIGAGNVPGNYDYTVSFTDDELTPNTGQVVVRIILTDAAPGHSAGAGIASGDGSSGTPYLSNDQSKGSTATIALAAVTDANTGQSLAFVSATVVTSNPSTVFDSAFSLTGSTSSETLQVSGFTALADADVGTHTYDVVVDCGASSTTATIRVSIVVINAAPVLANPANGTGGVIAHGGTTPNFTGTATIGDNLALDFVATDADSADSIQVTIADLGTGSISASVAGFSGSFPIMSTAATSTSTGSLTGTAAAAGTVNLRITVDDGSGTANATATYDLVVTISAVPTPTITVTGSLTAFSSTGIGVSSGEQSYTVEGTDLTTDIVITPPTGFEISLTTGTGFQTTAINLAFGAGTVATTTIFVRYTPNTGGPHSGNITHTSAGSNNPNLAASGSIAGGNGMVTFSASPSNPGVQSANPGNSKSSVAFRLTETAGSSFELTGATADIVVANNGIGSVASVSISRGGTLATVTNGGTGWSDNGSTSITATFTFAANAIAASTSGDYVVTISFVGGASPKPAATFTTSVASGSLTGNGTVSNSITATGGTITLVNAPPNDPFADDDEDEDSCSLTAAHAPSWPLLLILTMLAVASIAAIKRRKA
ncbi:hypothetical protein OAU50_04575 [Planctomycetota bacterium]|nr:hypothetical protein [Planctomycetota bacterium]